MRTNRPIATVRTVPAAPIPLWERDRLFVEPAYTDGHPYDQAPPDVEGEDDGLKRPAA